MADTSRTGSALPAAAPLDGEEFRELKAAQNRAQKLRDQTIAKERARIEAIAALLEVSIEELVGLPKRQRRSKAQS